MGVDGRVRIAHDCEVDLHGRGPQEEDVPRNIRGLGAFESGAAQGVIRNFEPPPSRAVIRRKVQLDPDPGEADYHQADAVETVRRIAPLQPELSSDQLARRDG